MYDLPSCKDSAGSVQQFKRRSWNCLSQSVARRLYFYSDRPEKTNLIEDVEFLLPVEFRQIPLSCVGISKNVPVILVFFLSARKHALGRIHWVLASCQVSENFSQRFRGEVENVSANRRARWPSSFSDRPEKQKLGRGRWVIVSFQVSSNSV